MSIDTNFSEFSYERQDKLVAGGGCGVERIFVFK